MSDLQNTVFGTNAVAIDQSFNESRKQLSRLFQPVDIIEVRAIRKKPKATRHLYCTTETYPNIHRELCKLNDEGFSIYFGVLPRAFEGGTTAGHVLPGRVLCIDKDKIEAEQLLTDIAQAGLPKPAITISSGGGGQAFWVASEDINPNDWVAFQLGTITAVKGADSTVKDKPRIMRLAGFRNMKPEYEPRFPMARIIDFQEGGDVYVTSWPKGVKFSDDSEALSCIVVPDGYLSEKAKAFLEKGELFSGSGGGEPSRRQTAFAVACEARASNIPLEEVTPQIIERLAELGLADDELEDVERQIGNAYSRERSPNIDEADLPRVKLPAAQTRHTVYATDKGKVMVTVRYKDKAFTDTIDPKKADQRRRLIRHAGQQIGEGADMAELSQLLDQIAAGDITPEPAPSNAADLAFMEVDDCLFMRPERFFAYGPTESASGITVLVQRDSVKGHHSAWQTYINRGEQREVIDLPASVEVDGTTYYLSPVPIIPDKPMPMAWSKESRCQWHVTGSDVMPAKQLLEELVDAFSQFIELPEEQANAVYRLLALFSVLTYNSPAFSAVPYLAINGPSGSGKTRVLDCLKETVFRPISVSSTSAAAVFRQLDNRGGCLIFDEAEQLNTAETGVTGELYPCLLAGYKRDGVAARCQGENHEIREFSVYGPKVLTSIRELPETLASRCINLIMQRSRKGSKKALADPSKPQSAKLWQRLRDALHCFSINRGQQMLQLAEAESVVPADMFPRSREIWAPILQLAHLFEQEGATGLLGQMQEFAKAKAGVAEQLLVPDLDVAVLRAAAFLSVSGSKQPTAGEIATRAQVADAGTTGSITPRQAGSILRRYGLQSRIKQGRHVYEVPPSAVSELKDRYGIIFACDDTETTPPVPLSKPPTSPTSPTSARKVQTGDVGDVGDHLEGDSPPQTTTNGKVRPGKVVF